MGLTGAALNPVRFRALALGALLPLLVSPACSRTPAARSFVAPTTIAATSPAPDPSPTPPATALTRKLDALWAMTPDGCLRVESAGALLYETNAGGTAEPASTLKILTALAAFDILGPATRFKTVVAATSPPIDGVIKGDLWLVGGGDPVLATQERAAKFENPQPYTSLDELAGRLAAAGVKSIEGRVMGDESRYDRVRYVDSLPERFITGGEIGPMSALALNDGFATRGSPGRPFNNPPADAAAVFQNLLRAKGIVISGEASAGTAPAGAYELASVESAGLSELIVAMLQSSDNGTAEMLVKEMGLRTAGSGTTSAGVAAFIQSLTKRALPVRDIRLGDGSGLSPLNRVSCRLLTAALTQAPVQITDGLSVAGQSGALARRFVGTPITGRLRAKTGSVDGVSALAGFVDGPSGAVITFAYIANGLPKAMSARVLQDLLAQALITEGDGP